MKLGAACDQSRIAWRLAVIEVATDGATFSYRLECGRETPVSFSGSTSGGCSNPHTWCEVRTTPGRRAS
jgi:hypothetical protein